MSFNTSMLLRPGNDTREFEDEIFTMKELENPHGRLGAFEMPPNRLHSEDMDSEFSLGTGTQTMIKMKAESILE